MSLDPQLIICFLRNECNEEERILVADYLSAHPEELEHYLDEAEWLRFESTEPMLPARSASMKQQIMQAIHTPAKVKRISYGKLAAAAMLCVLVSVSAYLWWQHNAVNKQPAAGLAAAGNNMILISNPANDIKQVRMPDGSLVVLDAQSAIRYPQGFRSNRTIWLQGSALFDVSKDEAHPFQVNAGALDITVLGTRFKVDAVNKSGDMNIQLFNGKIRVTAGSSKNTTELLPGNELHYQQGTWTVRAFKGSQPEKLQPADPAKNYVPVQSDALVFENQPLPVVLETLASRFNTPIHYKERTIRAYYFSGEFTATAPLSSILNTICTLNSLQLKEDSTGYTLLPAKK